MSDTVREHPAAPADEAVLWRLSMLDRFLPAWILAAMIHTGRNRSSVERRWRTASSVDAAGRSRTVSLTRRPR